MPPSPSDDAVAPRPPTAAGATFVSHAAARGRPAADPAAAARMLDGVADALARWFGPFGYHALLTRALAHARPAHPALARVSVRAPLTPVLDGLAEAAQAHGGGATAEGVVAVVRGVVDLVGSVIGDDMALQLLERHMEEPVPTIADPVSDPVSNPISAPTPGRTAAAGVPTDAAGTDAAAAPKRRGGAP